MFCRRNRSRSSGSLESCLVMVHSVCLRRYDTSDHIQVDMKQVELVLYARAAALNFFCKQSGSRSSGSRESCLVMVHYVCLWGYEMSDHTQLEPICSCGGFKLFCEQDGSRSSGSRENCLITASFCLLMEIRNI